MVVSLSREPEAALLIAVEVVDDYLYHPASSLHLGSAPGGHLALA